LSVRLLFIEDDQAYQLAMATHLRALPDVDAVAVACDGEQGLEILEREAMDLVLLDLVLPGMGGLATCSEISGRQWAPVLMLTSQDDPHWVQRIWQAGARGYLHKEHAFEQVALALGSLMAGASWWDQRATAALRPPAPADPRHPRDMQAKLNGLTPREREVLECLAAGANNRLIASTLGIVEGTVRSHVHVLLQKLQADNRTQAALLWMAAERDRG
jgi:two-component system NarL family response regulator